MALTLRDKGGGIRSMRIWALAFGLLLSGGALFAGGASAQSDECARLRAALAAPVQSDPAAADAARKARAELDQTSGYAHSIGCDNQQFLFFGQAPPPQCGALKARIAAMRARFDQLQARASGDSGQHRALTARYNAACRENAAPREKSFFETLFGGGGEGSRNPQDVPAAPPPEEGAPGDGTGEGSVRGGGSQALCVRSCDGGFFPLAFSAHSASSGELLDLCKALCPNAEVQLFTRNPARDISTAVGVDGTPYEDLPNALKYTKAVEPNCACKPPNQSWVEALAHAEEVLNEMGGAKASDTTVTEQQAQQMSQPSPARPAKNSTDRKRLAAPASSPDNVGAIATPTASKTAGKMLESKAPDGTPRQVRVVGPNF